MTGHAKTKRRKRILLVNPWIYDFAAYDFWIKPLGLLTLGAILRENGFDVSVIDCLNPAYETGGFMSLPVHPKRTTIGTGEFIKTQIPRPNALSGFPRKYSRYGISVPSFHAALGRLHPPDLILVSSMMTYWYPGVFEAIRQVKAVYPAAPVILGGNYVTLCRDHAVHAGADRLVEGPGEFALPSLCRDFLNEDLSFLPLFDNYDVYPYPAFDLLPQNDQIPILTSRGVPLRLHLLRFPDTESLLCPERSL